MLVNCVDRRQAQEIVSRPKEKANERTGYAGARRWSVPIKNGRPNRIGPLPLIQAWPKLSFSVCLRRRRPLISGDSMGPRQRLVMKIVGVAERQECGRWLNNRAENSHQPFRGREGAMARFRDIKISQKFASIHASFRNYFNHDRHPTRLYSSKPLAIRGGAIDDSTTMPSVRLIRGAIPDWCDGRAWRRA